jgi:hypothetical protein
MRFRKLRIAFSATCLIACVLLIALWVRSFWWMDSASHCSRLTKIPERQFCLICFQSFRGSMGVVFNNRVPLPYDLPNYGWQVFAELVYKDTPFLNAQVGETLPSTLGFRWRPMNYGFAASVPDWFLALFAAAFATAPWFRWRFSLRTLLIATTLVAVVLGLAVWAVR